MNPYQSHTDEQLVTLLKQGNAQAFEVIYRRYVKDLFRYALSKVRVREDCEEIVHDVFASLWQRRERLVITTLRQYLVTSVRYMVIRYFSHLEVKRKYAGHYRLFEALYDTVEQEKQCNPSVIQALLLQHLQDLPDRCQEAIRLRITENLSNGEIAKRMQISKATVQLYISRAFAHLRGSYDKIFKLVE